MLKLSFIPSNFAKLLTTLLNTIYRKFKMQRRRESKKKAISWQGKTTTLHVLHAFLYISLLSLHDYHVKMPNFAFCEVRKQAITKFSLILFMNLDMVDSNSAPEEFACIWQSKRVGIITIETEEMWIHFSCDVFVAVSCRGMIDASVNSCCKLKLVSLEKRL